MSKVGWGLVSSVLLVSLAACQGGARTANVTRTGTATITITDLTTCTVNVSTIECDHGNNDKKCKENDGVEWDVQNNYSTDLSVLVHDLRHVATGMYVDPLVGPGNQGVHLATVSKGATPKALKTKVRKVDAPFVDSYKYSVSVSTDGQSWSGTCTDPMIDIGG